MRRRSYRRFESRSPARAHDSIRNSSIGPSSAPRTRSGRLRGGRPASRGGTTWASARPPGPGRPTAQHADDVLVADRHRALAAQHLVEARELRRRDAVEVGCHFGDHALRRQRVSRIGSGTPMEQRSGARFRRLKLLSGFRGGGASSGHDPLPRCGATASCATCTATRSGPRPMASASPCEVGAGARVGGACARATRG